MAKNTLVTQISEADLRLLRIFRAVAESGGLSAAETDLNIGRSTISKHIADLEFRLDLKLCNRGPAGFSLTEDGVNVLQAAHDLFASVESFRMQVNELKEDLAGSIRISMFDQCATNPDAHVSAAIQAFNESAPNVEIELSLEPPNNIEAKVLDGTLDIGIVALHRPSANLEYHPIYGEDMYLYCASGHPLFDREQYKMKLSEVRKFPYAGISVNSPNMLIGRKLKLTRAAKVQSEQALAILVLSGRYIGFLPDHFARDFVRRGLMRAVLPDRIHYQTKFASIHRRRPGPNRVTLKFLEILKSVHNHPNRQ